MRILKILLFVFSLNICAKTSLCENPSLKYKEIYCCIDNNLCTQEINQNLTQDLLDHIKKQNLDQASSNGPNCYWAALNHLFGSAKYPPRYIQGINLSSEFSQILKKDFIQISKKDLRVGDLVVFYSKNVQKKVMAEDMRSKVWVKFKGTTEHAAIWLGDNNLFQKEGHRKDNFSISTYNQAFDFYRKNLNSGMWQSGDLEARFYKVK